MSESFPIVGAYYRPPAQAVLNALPVGAALTLMAEPENPHDPNAIGVWINTADIPKTSHDKLSMTLPDSGYTLEALLNLGELHLGYIPREIAAKLRGDSTVMEDQPIKGSLFFSPSGLPRVRLGADE